MVRQVLIYSDAMFVEKVSKGVEGRIFSCAIATWQVFKLSSRAPSFGARDLLSPAARTGLRLPMPTAGNENGSLGRRGDLVMTKTSGAFRHDPKVVP